MLPRWAGPAVHNNGVEWGCMECMGESPRELIEWANDAKLADAEQREIDAANEEERMFQAVLP